jgi:hypothetical protein
MAGSGTQQGAVNHLDAAFFLGGPAQFLADAPDRLRIRLRLSDRCRVSHELGHMVRSGQREQPHLAEGHRRWHAGMANCSMRCWTNQVTEPPIEQGMTTRSAGPLNMSP